MLGASKSSNIYLQCKDIYCINKIKCVQFKLKDHLFLLLPLPLRSYIFNID